MTSKHLLLLSPKGNLPGSVNLLSLRFRGNNNNNNNNNNNIYFLIIQKLYS